MINKRNFFVFSVTKTKLKMKSRENELKSPCELNPISIEVTNLMS